MVKKITKIILLSLLLGSYIFFFVYWGCSKFEQASSNEKKYKNEESTLVAKEKIAPVIKALIEAEIIQENDIEELGGRIIDDYIEKYGVHSFHCNYRYKIKYNDYYIELGCNYYPEMDRSINHQFTLMMKIYYVCELDQNSFENRDIDFIKMDKFFDIISGYLLNEIDSRLIERYYNKQALLDDYLVSYPFGHYKCQYDNILLSYSIRDCRDEVGSHYDKKVLPDGIDGYISLTIETTLYD